MSWRFVWRWLWRDLRQGDALVVLLALTIAVAAMTAVGLFTERIGRLLEQQSNALLAADAVISADHPIATQYTAISQRYQLRMAQTWTFPSMVQTAQKNQLVTIKGVDEHYPLRGDIRLQDGTDERIVTSGPAPGEIWADQRLLDALSVKVGDSIQVGERAFPLTRVITREPDAVMDLYNFIPRILINIQDLPGTGLILPGSRIRYRVLVAGPPEMVASWHKAVSAKMGRGERMETVREARVELNTALDRAETFLRLAALTSVCLAAAALLLTTRRYVGRHLDSAAVLRTLGSTQYDLVSLFVRQFMIIGTVSAILGSVIGWGAQFLLAGMMSGVFPGPLPAHSSLPFIFGAMTGVVLLLGFAVPPLINLANVPALRVLRREMVPQMHAVILGVCGLAALFLLMWWQAGSMSLTLIFTGSMAGTLLLAALLGWGLLGVGHVVVRGHLWRMSIRNLLRHRVLVLLQIAALALGVMAILLLTVVRDDLISAWERSVPADAPNRFIINIQPQNVAEMTGIMQQNGLPDPVLHPMLRARLISIEGKPVEPARYPDERTQRLAAREFNLSWGDTQRNNSQIRAGRPLDEAANEFSVESDIARRLGIHLGDVLEFDIGGTRYRAPVTSLRQVNWDSFRVNFFVVGTQKLLGHEEGSLITSFYLPPDKHKVAYLLTQAMPNLTVIDVEAILKEVRQVIYQASQALQLVFIFCIAAGLVVLLALILSVYDERRHDVAVLRALGGSNRALCTSLMFEWLLLGGVSGLVAGAAAAGMGFIAAHRLFNLNTAAPDWFLPVAACLGTAGVVLVLSLPFLRRLLHTSPLELLREAG